MKKKKKERHLKFTFQYIIYHHQQIPASQRRQLIPTNRTLQSKPHPPLQTWRMKHMSTWRNHIRPSRDQPPNSPSSTSRRDTAASTTSAHRGGRCGEDFHGMHADSTVEALETRAVGAGTWCLWSGWRCGSYRGGEGLSGFEVVDGEDGVVVICGGE